MFACYGLQLQKYCKHFKCPLNNFNPINDFIYLNVKTKLSKHLDIIEY